MRETEATTEARRQMEICNACRYCEGYCAVFPAMAMRREFSTGDLTHLANLCHGCKGCYHACQYSPPHAFGVNVPQTFATLRAESYAEYAWPPAMGRLFERNGTVVMLVTALVVTLVLLLTVALQDPAILFAAQTGTGTFFRIIPGWLITGMVVLSVGYAAFAMTMGALRYWRGTAPGAGQAPITPGPVATAAVDILTLRNLGGGGHGCNDMDDSFSQTRRWLHHAVFYGFMLAMAGHGLSAFYHYALGWEPPHAFFSLPKQLGVWGGVLLVIGAVGLIRVKIVTDPVPVAKKLLGSEYALLALLLLTASLGLLLHGLRGTGAMGVLLALHLGFALAFFLLMPYSKMVHGVYRGLALLRNAQERGAKEGAKAPSGKGAMKPAGAG